MELRNVISQRYSLYDDWRNYGSSRNCSACQYNNCRLCRPRLKTAATTLLTHGVL